MTSAVIAGNDQVTGHIISTTIGGKNGEPKQVRAKLYTPILQFIPVDNVIRCLFWFLFRHEMIFAVNSR